jgi:predicted dehydrogenase
VLRIGVIGAGRVAQIAHLATFSQLPDARIIALADLRPELAARVARHWNVPRVYADHRALLSDAEVDAVIVVTQRTQTAAIAADALRAGKHVLSEKPMALSSADATQLAELARERARVYAVGYMKRYDRGIAAAHEQIRARHASGEMGALVAVSADHAGGDDQAGTDWLMTAEDRTDLGLRVTDAVGDPTPKSAFDRFLNVYSHTTNLVRHLTGSALTFTHAAQDGDRAVLTGTLAGGAAFTGSLSERETHGWHERVQIRFERATVTVEAAPPFDRQASARVFAEFAGGRAGEDWTLPGWAFARQAAAFVQAVAGGAEPLAPGHDSIADVALGEAFWRLSRSRAR